jgi:hypothetical protein
MAWARRQRSALLSPEQAAALDAVYPSWRHSKDEVWQARLLAVESFFKMNGRYPSQRAADAEEKLIGMWLKNNRFGGIQSTPERRAIIDSRLPDWNPSRDDVWASRLEEVVTLVGILGRLPRMSDSPEERRARKWLNHQANGPVDRLRAIDSRIPGWRADTPGPGKPS